MPGNASWLKALIGYVEGRGASRAKLLSAAGVDDAELEDPGARISEAQEVSLWRESARAVPDPLLGLRFGCSIADAGAFGVLGYLGRAGRTWSDALDAIERYHLLLDFTRAQVRRGGEVVTLSFVMSPALQPLRHPGEALLAGALTAWRNAIGRHDRPLEVAVPHPAGTRANDCARVLDSTVAFGTTSYAIVWHEQQVRSAHLATDPQARRYFERAAERALKHSAPRSLVDEVRGEVTRLMERGAPSLDAVARRLSLSQRTLQRKLGEAGGSFRKVVDEERRRRAMGLVESTSLSVSEIAYGLGFEDVSAFRRAFHRWVGRSPLEERRRRRSARVSPANDRLTL